MNNLTSSSVQRKSQSMWTGRDYMKDTLLTAVNMNLYQELRPATEHVVHIHKVGLSKSKKGKLLHHKVHHTRAYSAQ